MTLLTQEQLREEATQLERENCDVMKVDQRTQIALLRAYADALEELARVKKAISESCDEQRGEYFGCRRAERAEAALAESERKCGRLKFHAEAMAEDLDAYLAEVSENVSAYRAEFKE